LLDEYLGLILTLHILSAIIWIGGMITFIFSLYPSVLQIPNDKLMIRTSIRSLRRYFKILLPAVVILGISGVLMELSGNYDNQAPTIGAMIGAKEAIFVLMAVNFIFGFYKIKEAKQRCMKSDIHYAQDNIRLVIHYFFTLNVLLGIFSLYFGIMIRIG
jgi:uncharacterized membrane protein